MIPSRWRPWLAALFLLALNLALNEPLFRPGDTRYRDSIEPGYASMARFISEHPDPFGWNPYQYNGLPTHMWYLPVIPYLGAITIRVLAFMEPENAYRVMIVALTCLGPITFFVFVRFFTRSTRWAFGGALLYTFFSPSYFAYEAINYDRGLTYLPWRMQVLTKYGEGPHNAGLSLLPLALVACWRAAVGRRFGQVFLAAVLLAAVCLTNWVAALALAWCCLMMLLAGAGSAPETGFLHRRVLFSAVLAYLLSCFWLTPQFIRTTLLNWPQDAFGYKVDHAKYILVAGLIAASIFVRFAFLRFRRHYYLCFLCCCFLGFSYVASLHYWFAKDTIPESRRYALEAEWFLFALLIEIARLLVRDGRVWMRDTAVALLAATVAWGLPQVGGYLSHKRPELRAFPKETTIEYRVAKLLSDLKPAGRVFVTGGTRFRLNAWFLLPQVGGTFESGLLNRYPHAAIYHIRTGYGGKPDRRQQDAINLVRLLGAEYIAVHGARSKEHWRDVSPSLFDGGLREVFHEQDDVVYRAPFRGLARVVLPNELPDRWPLGYDVEKAEPYVAALDATDRPRLDMAWRGPSRFELRGSVPPGTWLSVMVSFDRGWRAWQDGRPLPVESDAIGHILVKPAPASEATFRFEYGPTRERIALCMVSALSWIAAVALWIKDRRRRRAI